MKIGNPLDKPALPPVASPRGDEAAGKASAGSGAATTTVALSTTAAALLRGSEATQVGPVDFDQAKVDAISGAIARGEFKINPDAIADKLLANARELLDRSSH